MNSCKTLVMTLSQQVTTGKISEAVITLNMYWRVRAGVDGQEQAVLIAGVNSDEVVTNYSNRIAEQIKAKDSDVVQTNRRRLKLPRFKGTGWPTDNNGSGGG